MLVTKGNYSSSSYSRTWCHPALSGFWLSRSSYEPSWQVSPRISSLSPGSRCSLSFDASHWTIACCWRCVTCSFSWLARCSLDWICEPWSDPKCAQVFQPRELDLSRQMWASPSRHCCRYQFLASDRIDSRTIWIRRVLALGQEARYLSTYLCGPRQVFGEGHW